MIRSSGRVQCRVIAPTGDSSEFILGSVKQSQDEKERPDDSQRPQTQRHPSLPFPSLLLTQLDSFRRVIIRRHSRCALNVKLVLPSRHARVVCSLSAVESHPRHCLSSLRDKLMAALCPKAASVVWRRERYYITAIRVVVVVLGSGGGGHCSHFFPVGSPASRVEWCREDLRWAQYTRGCRSVRHRGIVMGPVGSCQRCQESTALMT